MMWLPVLMTFKHLAGVGRVHPQFAAAAALEHEISGRRHHAAVVAADAGRGFVLPHGLAGHRIPGAQQFALGLAVARGLDAMAMSGSGPYRRLEVRGVVGVIEDDAVDREEPIDDTSPRRRCAAGRPRSRARRSPGCTPGASAGCRTSDSRCARRPRRDRCSWAPEYQSACAVTTGRPVFMSTCEAQFT